MNYNPSILLIAVPLLMAFLSLFIGIFSKRLTAILLVISSAFSLSFSLYVMNIVASKGVMTAIISNFGPPFGINLTLTFASMLFLSLIYLAVFVSSIIFLSKEHDGQTDRIASLIFLYTASVSGLLLTGDIFNMFVFFEIFAVANISLISVKKNGFALKGAFKYLLISSVGSAFYLFGVGMIYAALGTLNIAEIALRFHELSAYTGGFIFVMFLGALMSETETFPFNFWITDSYEGARNYVNILLGSASSIAAIYVFFRIFLTVMGYPINNSYEYFVSFDARTVVSFIAAASVIVSETAALSSRKVKRILALSSASQMGVIMFALIIGNGESLAAAVILIVNLSLSKALIFLSSHEIMKKDKSKEIDSFVGGMKRNPLFSVLFITGALSLVGMPFTPGFYGKLLLGLSIPYTSAYFILLLSVIFLSYGAELFYYFRLMHRLFSPGSSAEAKSGINPYYAVAGILILSALLFIAFNPSFIGRISSSASIDMMDKSSYIERVLKAGAIR